MIDEEATHPSSQWQFRVASSTDRLPRLRSRLRRLLRPLGLPRSTLHDIILSTHEAVVNGMVHGNGLDPAKQVTVTVTIGGEGVVVYVADEGPGFGWRAWLRHLRREGQDPMALRGRGVLLMSRLMDRVCFNEAGNAVELVKRLGS
jgi:anti-sigma regulatory factor (Ser/Thr protein kinase)